MSYPPIYIINLKRNPERKLYIQRQLDAFNLNYQFVNAVDKYDLASQKYRTTLAHQLGIKEYNFERMYEKLDTNFACSLSHIKVYNLMIEKNIARACILEDDGYLLSSFPKILTRAEKIPWDILMLSSQIKYTREKIKEYIYSNKWRHTFLDIIYEKKFGLHIKHLILLKTIKYIMLHLKKEKQLNTAWTCEIGALPLGKKSSWHKLASNHYVARPYIDLLSDDYNLTSGMAYMLTHTAAAKWKQVATSIPVKAIDKIPIELYLKENLDLWIITLPCVIAARNYLIYSAREHHKI